VERPYLSIVMTSRNDNHGGDLNKRTQMCVDGLSEQIKKFGISAEIIIVDWNPPKDRPLLHKAIKGKFRSIIVPEEIHNRYGQSKLFPLYQMVAKNAGIRRSRGEYVLATNVDILFSDEVMKFISTQKLAKRHLYRAYRYDARPDSKNLEDAKNNLIRINLSYSDDLCTNACGDFQLMHRSDWFDLRGYYELDLFSIHIDSILEYHAVYNEINEVVLRPPKVIYHIEHKAGWVPGVEASKEYNRMNDSRIKKLSYEDFLGIIKLMSRQKVRFHYNKENWGLADDRLEEIN